MALTSRDLAGGGAPVQRHVASLVGGFVIAGGCFVLALLVAGQLAGGMPGWPAIVGAALFATLVGIWIRLADL